MSKAVFVGRFQPLHLGHHEVIKKYREEYEDFLVVIGSADKERTGRNPLSAEERKDIIHECFPDLEVMEKDDEGDSDDGNQRWAELIEEKTNADIVISRNERVLRLIDQHTDMETEEQEEFDPEIYSGEEVRRRIRSGEEWRYLTPECARDTIAEYLEIFKKSGIQYEFKPGWKKENIKRTK